MIKTAIILILTIIVMPLVAYNFGTPLTVLQLSILWNCVYICLAVSLICFFVGEITQNYSQVDKIWSIVPLVYAWLIAFEGGLNNRLILMAALVSLWGIRLTYNFSRKGAYSWKFWEGEEDYRWAVLRQKPELKGRTRWALFNFFFISFYQNTLILLFTLPVLVAVNGSKNQIGLVDYIATFLFITFLVFETIADQQQWNYQKQKHQKIKSAENLDDIYQKGFVHTGLWKYMRHPNYMAEQAIWICFYFLGVAANSDWINWSVAGCLLLLVLFQGSSDFSESISMQKYPQYTDYKKNTGRFLPRL